MAQWWSIALPRRGSRVRIPSRAFLVFDNIADVVPVLDIGLVKEELISVEGRE